MSTTRMHARWGEAITVFEHLVTIETDDCVIWPLSKNHKGYGSVRSNGVQRGVHVLALERRVGSRPNGLIATHGPCHRRDCMNYRHLRWATYSENMQDRWRDGTPPIGENGPAAKLTARQVAEIRSLADYRTSGELAVAYGVAPKTIRDLIQRKTWSHVA
jgi:hypothetical protein